MERHSIHTKTLSALQLGYFVIFFAIVFFAPEGGGYFLEKPNFEEADFLKTLNILHQFGTMPFYSILRAITFGIPFLGITSKFLGFIIFAGSIAILFIVPWLDRSNVQSIRYKESIAKLQMILLLLHS